jgi:hypothetical protein
LTLETVDSKPHGPQQQEKDARLVPAAAVARAAPWKSPSDTVGVESTESAADIDPQPVDSTDSGPEGCRLPSIGAPTDAPSIGTRSVGAVSGSGSTRACCRLRVPPAVDSDPQPVDSEPGRCKLPPAVAPRAGRACGTLRLQPGADQQPPETALTPPTDRGQPIDSEFQVWGPAAASGQAAAAAGPGRRWRGACGLSAAPAATGGVRALLGAAFAASFAAGCVAGWLDACATGY